MLACPLLRGGGSGPWHYDFSNDGRSPVPYDQSTGHGLITGNPASDTTFVWAMNCPEGNYRVEVGIAAGYAAEAITVKAESRRLMIGNFEPPDEGPATVTFSVNVRTPKLESGGEVKLNQREIGAWHWNERLELEFHAPPGSVDWISVKPAENLTTLYLAGDSTVTDQPEEPWTGWGQILPRFFGPGVAVANHAESGLALSTFFAHRRFDKILESIGPGDYLLIQFGHNDMKESGVGIGPWQSYRESLRKVIVRTREAGAQPVLITPMQRRRFDQKNRQFATLGDYPLAMRRVAAELDVALIDLNRMSATLYAALGPEDSKAAFVHYPAGTFPGQDEALRDNTHFNAYGGHQLARCIVEGIRLRVPALTPFLRDDVGPYDPASPDPIGTFTIPASPRATMTKPAGN